MFHIAGFSFQKPQRLYPITGFWHQSPVAYMDPLVWILMAAVQSAGVAVVENIGVPKSFDHLDCGKPLEAALDGERSGFGQVPGLFQTCLLFAQMRMGDNCPERAPEDQTTDMEEGCMVFLAVSRPRLCLRELWVHCECL